MIEKRKIELEVPIEFEKERIDLFIAKLNPDNSRTFFQRLIKNGSVKLNDEICKVPRILLTEGDTVVVEWPESELAPVIMGEDIPLNIIYEDETILVLNKQTGMIVHPGAGNPSGTIVNALVGRDPGFSSDLPTEGGRPGIVHRLDKDTSGCMVIAKTSSALFKLSKAFAARKVHKTYAALVWGVPRHPEEKIVTLIGRHKVHRQKMAVVNRNGKQAITCYELMNSGRIADLPASLLAVKIMTGRTHQIRVHMANLNMPVIADKIYGKKNDFAAPRQMLHAWKLSFEHPVTGERMDFTAPFPDDFNQLAEQLKNTQK